MTFVANQAGRKKILWGEIIRLSLILLPISTGATSLAYIVIAQRWNALAAWLGLAGGAASVLVILAISLTTPRVRLPHIRSR